MSYSERREAKARRILKRAGRTWEKSETDIVVDWLKDKHGGSFLGEMRKDLASGLASRLPDLNSGQIMDIARDKSDDLYIEFMAQPLRSILFEFEPERSPVTSPGPDETLEESRLLAWVRWKYRNRFRNKKIGQICNEISKENRRRNRSNDSDGGNNDDIDKVPDKGPGPDDEVLGGFVKKQKLECLRLCLDQLPSNLRQAIDLCYLQDEVVSQREAATTMDITDGHLRQLLFRAKERLRACIKECLKERGVIE